MFKFFKRLFFSFSMKNNNLSSTEAVETKKCLGCLNRVDLHFLKCPFCRKDNFQYDS